MKDIVEEWCLLNGYCVDNWLGSGDFGEAYLTTCGKVVKLTTDVEEFVAAARIENINDDNLIQIYKTDSYKDELIILMEHLETENVEDLFNEISNAAGEDSIESLAYADSEDYEMSNEAHFLFSDLQDCIQAYQKSGTNPMDIHSGNIGKNSKGNYVLFDQKDKVADLSEELSKILEKKEKDRLFASLNADKVEISHVIKELDFTPSDFNTKMMTLMEEVVNQINVKNKSITTVNNAKSHPDIEFPNAVEITIHFTTNPDTFSFFDMHGESGGNVLGVHAITTGDGLLGESLYMDNHAVVILIDEDIFNQEKSETYKTEEEFIKSYITTLTHELSHAYEFIERSGGMSPRELDNVHEVDIFEFDSFDCSTGYNILPMFDVPSFSDYDEIRDIMEDRVELKGRQMIERMDLDKAIELFIASPQNTNKSKVKNRP